MLKLENRRCSIEIIADILRLGEASKAEIIYAAKMSYYQSKKYLDHLLKLELLDRAMTGNQLVTYRVTKKGLNLLRDIDVIQKMLEGKEQIDI